MVKENNIYNDEYVFSVPDGYFNEAAAEILAQTVGEDLDVSASRKVIELNTINKPTFYLRKFAWLAAAAVIAGVCFTLWYTSDSSKSHAPMTASEEDWNEVDWIEVLSEETNDDLLLEYAGHELDSISFLDDLALHATSTDLSKKKEAYFEHMSDQDLMDILLEEAELNEMDF